MKIDNIEVLNLIEYVKGKITVCTLRKLDKLITYVKENPGNIQECCRIVAKEFDTTPDSIAQLYYFYRKDLTDIIAVQTQSTKTVRNTKNDLSGSFTKKMMKFLKLA